MNHDEIDGILKHYIGLAALTNPDTTPAGDIRKLKDEAKAALTAYIERRERELIESIRQEMRMHTVPEGSHLITRSYLENVLDFKLVALTAGGKK